MFAIQTSTTMNYKLKLLLALLFTSATFNGVYAQKSAAFHWFNTPKQWKATGNNLTLTVEPNTDYWRITHYGFIRDSGPFYYQEVAGDFEATVKITGQYKELFHQAGLMIRTDNKNWIKTGIEYVDGVQNVSAVVTHNVSDWSVVPRHDSPKSMWLSLLRKGDYVQIKYSFDGVKYDMLRLAYFRPKVKVQIGVVAAAPGKQKFDALFENFTVKPVK
jgi:regulation of enolase protein 1 (concanavalin A-like superfamily)